MVKLALYSGGVRFSAALNQARVTLDSHYNIGGSANGRPIDSESINLGSNPSPPARLDTKRP